MLAERTYLVAECDGEGCDAEMGAVGKGDASTIRRRCVEKGWRWDGDKFHCLRCWEKAGLHWMCEDTRGDASVSGEGGAS